MNAAKKTLFATLAVATAAAAIAAPAAAQSYGHDRRDHGQYEQNRRDHDGNINARQAQIAQRIEWGVRRGTLDQREAYRLRSESRDIARLEAQFRYDGLTRVERARLDSRLDRLELRVARETHDRDYGAGYGRR
jgi:Spy/CpxP family protein refolding chaperone